MYEIYVSKIDVLSVALLGIIALEWHDAYSELKGLFCLIR